MRVSSFHINKTVFCLKKKKRKTPENKWSPSADREDQVRPLPCRPLTTKTTLAACCCKQSKRLKPFFRWNAGFHLMEFAPCKCQQQTNQAAQKGQKSVPTPRKLASTDFSQLAAACGNLERRFSSKVQHKTGGKVLGWVFSLRQTQGNVWVASLVTHHQSGRSALRLAQ